MAEVRAESAPWLAGLYPIQDWYEARFAGEDRAYQARSREGRFEEDRTVLLRAGVATVAWRQLSPRPAEGTSTKPVPPGTEDPVTALYRLRESPPAEGEERRFPVHTGRRVAWIVATRCDPEPGLACVELREGSGAGRAMTIWLTDDEDRVPARARIETSVGSVWLHLEHRVDPRP